MTPNFMLDRLDDALEPIAYDRRKERMGKMKENALCGTTNERVDRIALDYLDRLLNMILKLKSCSWAGAKHISRSAG